MISKKVREGSSGSRICIGKRKLKESVRTSLRVVKYSLRVMMGRKFQCSSLNQKGKINLHSLSTEVRNTDDVEL